VGHHASIAKWNYLPYNDVSFFLPEALIKYGLVELNLNRTKKQDLALPHIKHRAL
jgi:hypothetical protein